MGIDTYLIVPTRTPARAAKYIEVEPGDGTLAHVGGDYLVLYKTERFAEVESDPEEWGPRYAEELSPSIKKGLDPRGLLACPEVGQEFASKTYEEEVARHDPPLWLPIRRPRRKKRETRLLLVALSQAREAMLFKEPELVLELLESRGSESIPGTLEMGASWVELQKVLFDAIWQETGKDDPRAEALTPLHGLSFYEDKTVDSSRLVRADAVRPIAQWVTRLSKDLVARVEKVGIASPLSAAYPASLGASEADDHEPLRSDPARVRKKPARDIPGLQADLERLKVFYLRVLRDKCAVLSVRFRS